MIASTTPGTHNPRISAQNVTNHLLEIGERPHYKMTMFYMRRFFFGLVNCIQIIFVGVTDYTQFLIAYGISVLIALETNKDPDASAHIA